MSYKYCDFYTYATKYSFESGVTTFVSKCQSHGTKFIFTRERDQFTLEKACKNYREFIKNKVE